jgi:S-DNA-T family DNA segregation ATPase FtsK/SpoIIIE
MGRRRKQKNPLDYISIPSLNVSSDIKQSIWAVLFLTLGIISFLSLFELAGQLGVYLLKAMYWLAGWGAFLIPLLLLLVGWQIYKNKEERTGTLRYLGATLFLWSFLGMLQLFVSVEEWDMSLKAGEGGGHIGWTLAVIVFNLVGFWAGIIIILALIIIALMLMFNTNLGTLFHHGTMPARLVSRPFSFFFRKKESALAEEYDHRVEEGNDADDDDVVNDTFSLHALKDTSNKIKSSSKIKPDDEKMSWKPTNIKIDLPLDLLNSRVYKPTSGDIKSNIEIIKSTLEKFNIPVEMGEVSVGPTVTQYTLKPSEGIKLSRITGLNNDLSMALAAHPVRIEAPIPGKALVGIEVPNRTVAIVNLREVLESDDFKRRSNNLLIALGKDVAGKVWLDSISKMPHLLVAGATGSGKSVMLNTLIISLLYQNNPDDLKFIMVDPKRVELTVYNGLPHLLTPVITEVSKTINALKWCLNEMDRRFETLSQVHKRDIEGYNQVAIEKMPYIIFIIDELADLMVVAPKEMETGVVRLAQMARAVGIHLVLATQRPSVNVITGTIKANMPARIAFSVTSGIDSRTILDSLGAEKLLGRGDMLFSSVSLTKPKRIQGALITDQEIKRIVSYIKEKSGGPNYITEIVERQKVRGVAGVGMDGGSNDDDELFQEAKELIINSGKASASFLQRRLSIGYARAARLLDILEESGIIGPSNGAKAREIMVSKEQYEAMIEDGVAGARLHDQATAQAPDNYLGDDGEKPEGESEDEDNDSSDSDEEVNDDSGDKKLSNSTVDDEGEVPEFMSENPDGYEGEDEDIVPTSSPVEKKSEKGPEKDSDNSNFERYFSR